MSVGNSLKLSNSPPEFAARSPLAELVYLALPTMAQMASYTVMQFIDTKMLSELGTLQPTAAANAGMVAFSFISFGFGVLMIVNAMVSQNFGQRDYPSCGRYLWQGVWFSVLYSLLLLPVLPIAPKIFTILGHGPQLASLQTQYLQIVLGLAVFKLVGTALGQFLLATNRPNQVLLSTVIGVGTNALAAWAMIFGHLGFKPMGVDGAAWAQNVGVFVEMLVLIYFAMRSQARGQFNVFDWRYRAAEFATLVKIGAGSGLQVAVDVVAWSLFCAGVMAQLGENEMAANTFMFRYMVVSFMPAFGLSQAVTALVGRYIGMGKPDVAAQRANLGFKLAAVYMVLCGLVFAVFRHELIGAFRPTPAVAKIGVSLMIFAAIYQFFDAMYITYNGALRGAGDTAVPAAVTAVSCWMITVCGGWMVARYFPQFGVAGPWTCATIYGIILGIFMLARFRRGAWKQIRIEPIEAPHGFEVAPAAAAGALNRSHDSD